MSDGLTELQELQAEKIAFKVIDKMKNGVVCTTHCLKRRIYLWVGIGLSFGIACIAAGIKIQSILEIIFKGVIS